MINGVAMGSPLSPMWLTSTPCVEKFSELGILSVVLKLKCWLRYVVDTFVVWSHREEELIRLLAHLNSVHLRIQFTLEREGDDQLAFLDVLVLRRADASLRHKVYRKLTHTDRDLHNCPIITQGRRGQF